MQKVRTDVYSYSALRASVSAAVILVVAVVAGQIILDAIGIHLRSFKVAGGIILFLFGLQTLFGRAGANVSTFRNSSLHRKPVTMHELNSCRGTRACHAEAFAKAGRLR